MDSARRCVLPEALCCDLRPELFGLVASVIRGMWPLITSHFRILSDAARLCALIVDCTRISMAYGCMRIAVLIGCSDVLSQDGGNTLLTTVEDNLGSRSDY